MANAIKGEHAFTFEDREYVLVLDINAFCEIETEFAKVGVTVKWDGVYASACSGSVAALRALMWAGVKNAGGDLTLTDAGTLVQAMGGVKALKEIMEAVSLAFPSSKKKTAGEGKKPANPPRAKPKPKRRRAGTGKSSSRSTSRPAAARTTSGG